MKFVEIKTDSDYTTYSAARVRDILDAIQKQHCLTRSDSFDAYNDVNTIATAIYNAVAGFLAALTHNNIEVETPTIRDTTVCKWYVQAVKYDIGGYLQITTNDFGDHKSIDIEAVFNPSEWLD